jgi:hypothetical protein
MKMLAIVTACALVTVAAAIWIAARQQGIP